MSTPADVDLEQKVLQAIAAGNINQVEEELRSHGHSIKNYRQADGATLLHLSVLCGPADMTKELLLRGVDINAQTIVDKATALHMAASSGRLTTVELLLEALEVDDTIRDNADRTPLDLVQLKPLKMIFRYARSRFVQSTLDSLNRAVQQGQPQTIINIMKNHRAAVLVDVNTPDVAGETLLHRAAQLGRKDVVKACLQIGVNPFAKNRRGKMPLELCQSDEIRELLRQAPMGKSPELPLSDDNSATNIAGYLLKYVNFASGYKRRYVALEDGLLSYYKTKEDYPVSCKGSLNVQFARLVIPPGDSLSFELQTNKYSLFFKAENQIDATRWKVALGKWQRNQKVENDMPGHTDAIMAARCLHSRSRTPTSSTGSDEYRRTLTAAQDCLNQLEARLARPNQEPSGATQLEGVPDPVVIQLLHSLQEFFAVCAQREHYWQARSETELKQRAMIEETLNRMRQKIKLDTKQSPILGDSSGSLPEIGEYNDEFYDAVEEAEALAALSISEEANDLLAPSLEVEDIILRTPSPERLAELEIPEIAVPQEDLTFVEDSLSGYQLVRRNRIPADSTQIPPISIWNIIKNAIGKDLTRIPIPVNFSEPISMLQRLAEDLEYADLLYLASISTDPLMRLQYAAAFAVSPYSSTDGRISKPFNPILGETFEYVSREHGFRYISEQVSHHPPISACHCESARYAYYAEVSVKTKFWGKSIELIPEGLNHIHLKTTGEHISYRKVNTAVYNLIMGKMWIDHSGTLRVVNHNSGDVVEIEFKPTGWRTTDPKRLEGYAYDSDGVPRYALEGYWNKYLRTRNLETGELVELWRRRPLPPWSDKMYNFTYFAMTLNELPLELSALLCPTDSRLRPDQRAMEDGAFEDANMIKVTLEEKQRAVRRSWEADPDYVYMPRWFSRELDKDTGEEYWRYLGDYWESRLRGEWGNCRNIYLSSEPSSTSSPPLETGGDANIGKSDTSTSSDATDNQNSQLSE